MYAVIKKAVIEVDGVQVKANFKILGRALEGGVSTAVSIFATSNISSDINGLPLSLPFYS